MTAVVDLGHRATTPHNLPPVIVLKQYCNLGELEAIVALDY